MTTFFVTKNQEKGDWNYVTEQWKNSRGIKGREDCGAVKGFSIVSGSRWFLEFSSFFYDLAYAGSECSFWE